MKRNNKYSLFFFFLLLVGGGFLACVNDDDYTIPDFELEEPDVTVNFTIADVLALLENEPVQINATVPLYLEGYVVSSDESGNFHKNLVIQDKPENPTAGISISTHATDMYTFFGPGRKVYVRVDGLYVGVFRGIPSLGENGDEIDHMSVEAFDARVLRSNIIEEIIPTEISINQVSDLYLNTLVQFNEVEFLAEYAGLTYADSDNTFGANRTIQDCFNNSLTMRNSGYADFRQELMPTGNGKLVAILSVFNTTYQLFIRDTEDVSFNEERCEEGGTHPEGGMPYKEDFAGHSAGQGSYVDLPDWTNVNRNGGERRYEVREFNRNNFVQISAYGSGEDPLEAWLITPGITLDKVSPVLVFDTKDGHFNGDALTVHVSTDFNSNIDSATWIDVTNQATISTGHSDWENNYTSSGEIDLSVYEGETVFIGFRYLGADFVITTTYQLDNIEIKSAQ